MPRKLFTFASLLSLLLCVATAVLWTRSYRNNSHGDQFQFVVLGRHLELLSQGGGVTLTELDTVPWFFSGPSTGGNRVAQFNSHDVLGFPYWLTGLATAILPVSWWQRARRTKRRKTLGLCAGCAYDLRATPDRCPECGTPVQKTRQASA